MKLRQHMKLHIVLSHTQVKSNKVLAIWISLVTALKQNFDNGQSRGHYTPY